MSRSVKSRPVHKLAFGRWRLNWRRGKYKWMWDWNSWGAGFCTPWAYVFVGRVGGRVSHIYSASKSGDSSESPVSEGTEPQ